MRARRQLRLLSLSRLAAHCRRQSGSTVAAEYLCQSRRQSARQSRDSCGMMNVESQLGRAGKSRLAGRRGPMRRRPDLLLFDVPLKKFGVPMATIPHGHIKSTLPPVYFLLGTCPRSNHASRTSHSLYLLCTFLFSPFTHLTIAKAWLRTYFSTRQAAHLNHCLHIHTATPTSVHRSIETLRSLRYHQLLRAPNLSCTRR